MSGQGHKTIRKVGRKKVEGSNAVAKAAAPRAPSPTVLDAFTLISQSSLDAIPTGFCVCRADTSLVRYNKRATELWGRELPLGEPTVRFAGDLRR